MSPTVAKDPEISGILKRPFAAQVAFFRGKLGNLIPTRVWTDVQKSAHDTGFMVAGAAKADLLADLAAAVDRVNSEGKGIDAFRQDFDAIVERAGWHYRGPRSWRTRVIYTTNVSTSYNAGRLAQLRQGGFPLWMYKHSDSVLHPRPLHVSWDGVTLPPDDPWWQTHYTPNGWGCHCRVIGVRSRAGAKRLGGDKFTAPDDGIDAKTGEPAGIDKGWGYMPGDTVAHTVGAMAEKTVQWPYTLAKAYMQNVPAGVRDDLARAYRGLPSVADDIRRYAQRVLDGKADLEIQPYRTMGLLTGQDVQRLAQLRQGVDVSGFDYSVDPSAIGHIRQEHGAATAEQPRGQRAVVASDYALLPGLLNAPDAIEYGGRAKTTGHPVFRWSKQIDGERFVAAFEVRTGRQMLGLQSLYVGGRKQ